MYAEVSDAIPPARRGGGGGGSRCVSLRGGPYHMKQGVKVIPP